MHQAKQQRAIRENGFLLSNSEFVAQQIVVDVLQSLEGIKEVSVVADRHDVVRSDSANSLVAQPGVASKGMQISLVNSSMSRVHSDSFDVLELQHIAVVGQSAIHIALHLLHERQLRLNDSDLVLNLRRRRAFGSECFAAELYNNSNRVGQQQ